MDVSFSDMATSSIHLLKERIIKVELLLEQYANLTKRFNNLEKSHSEVLENEKKAKKDAATYLQKYCKLTKKYSCLLNKTKSLEEELKDKMNAAEMLQSEIVKLESVIKVYKMERQTYQDIKKDKDFLLGFIYKILKISEEEGEEHQNRKAIEVFFSRFGKDLKELKLDNFRSKFMRKMAKAEFKPTKPSDASKSTHNVKSIDCAMNIPLENEKTDDLDSKLNGEFVKNCQLQTIESDKWGEANKSDVLSIEHIETGNGHAAPSTDVLGVLTFDTNKQEEVKIILNNFDSAGSSNDQENRSIVSNADVMNEKNHFVQCDDLSRDSSKNIERSSNNVEEKSSSPMAVVTKTRVKNVNDAAEKFDGSITKNSSLDPNCPLNSESEYLVNKNFSSGKTYRNRVKHTDKSFIPRTVSTNKLSHSDSLTMTASDLSSLNIDITETLINTTDFGVLSDGIDYLPPKTIERIQLNVGDTKTENNNLNTGESTLKSQKLETHLDEFLTAPVEVGQAGSVFDIPYHMLEKKSMKSIGSSELKNDGIQGTQCGLTDNKKADAFEGNEVISSDPKSDIKKSNALVVEVVGDKNISFHETGKSSDVRPQEEPIKALTSESFIQISDEEVFACLKSVMKYRLLSPLKEKPKKESEVIEKVDQGFNNNVMIFESNQQSTSCDIEKNINGFSSKLDEKNVQNLQKESHKMMKVPHKKLRKNSLSSILESETSRRKKENSSIKKQIISKSLIRKIYIKIWKDKLKKRFKFVDQLEKIWKFYSSCFAFKRMLFKFFKVSGLNNDKNFENRYRHLLKKRRKGLKNKFSIKTSRNSGSSWEVEDVEDTENTDVFQNNLFPFSLAGKKELYPEVTIFPDESNGYNMSKSISLQGDKSCHCLLLHKEVNQKSGNLDSGTWDNSKSLYPVNHNDIILQNYYSSFIINRREEDNEQLLNLRNNTFVDILFNHNRYDQNLIRNVSHAIPEYSNFHEPDIKSLNSYLKPETRDVNEVNFTEINKIKPPNVRKVKENTYPRRSARIRDRIDREKTEQNRLKDNTNLVKYSPQTEVFTDVNHIKDDCSEEVKESIANETLPAYASSRCTEEVSSKILELFGEDESKTETEMDGKNAISRNEKEILNSSVSAEQHLSKPDNDVVLSNPRNVKRRLSHISSSITKNNGKIMKSEMPDYSSENFHIENSDDKTRQNDAESSKTYVNEFDTRCNQSDSLLDCIMSAMTKQAEDFKSEVLSQEINISPNTNNQVDIKIPPTCPQNWMYGTINFADNSNKSMNNKHQNECKEDRGMKACVVKELNKFLKLDIRSAEEAEEKIKPCVAVLQNTRDDIIANVIVSEIMTNVDEEIQEFERPAPPLTQTQHRIMIILSIVSESEEKFQQMGDRILKLIWQKLFPETFFWPDDSLEMATRFYAALCKRLNSFKQMWKFCFKALSCMRQRWCIPIFVVLQTWPDILHNAKEVKDNLLVTTFINIILHTPKAEGMRKKRQEQKIIAIKHLLINFYNFEVNSTIEGFTEKLFDSLFNDVPASSESLILVSKCRNWSWTNTYIVRKLLEILKKWSCDKITDTNFMKVLDIIQQITPVFPEPDISQSSSVSDLISTFNNLLNSNKLNQLQEEKIIKILVSLCHWSSAKEILLVISQRFFVHDPLYKYIHKAISKSKCKKKKMNERKKIVKSSRHQNKAVKKKKKKAKNKRKRNNTLVPRKVMENKSDD